MTTRDLNVALIYGSSRQGRFCDTVAAWARAQIERHDGFRVSTVDPRDLAGGDGQAALRDALGNADAFVVVTPEYNHGYTAALKALVDTFGSEWHAKPVGFVSYGGVSGGLRAVEQLRLVFAELHAVTVRNTVSFANAQDWFDDAGAPVDGRRHQGAMAKLLADLRWWAAVLRHGRQVAPFECRAA